MGILGGRVSVDKLSRICRRRSEARKPHVMRLAGYLSNCRYCHTHQQMDSKNHSLHSLD